MSKQQAEYVRDLDDDMLRNLPEVRTVHIGSALMWIGGMVYGTIAAIGMQQGRMGLVYAGAFICAAVGGYGYSMVKRAFTETRHELLRQVARKWGYWIDEPVAMTGTKLCRVINEYGEDR